MDLSTVFGIEPLASVQCRVSALTCRCPGAPPQSLRVDGTFQQDAVCWNVPSRHAVAAQLALPNLSVSGPAGERPGRARRTHRPRPERHELSGSAGPSNEGLGRHGLSLSSVGTDLAVG